MWSGREVRDRSLKLFVLWILLLAPIYSSVSAVHGSPMHIQFERSGGFAGMRLTATIDSERLSSDDAATLRDLIAAARFFDLPAKSEKAATGADRFHYKVIAEMDARRHTIEIDESVVPSSLRPLLNWLTEKAKSQ